MRNKPEIRDIQNEFWKQIKEKDGVASIDECRDLGEEFYYHYESNGWMVGKTKMKKWKMAVATWVRQRKKYEPKWKVEQKEQQQRNRKVYSNQKDYGEVNYEAYKKRQQPTDRRTRMGFAGNDYLDFKKRYFQQRGQDQSSEELPGNDEQPVQTDRDDTNRD